MGRPLVPIDLPQPPIYTGHGSNGLLEGLCFIASSSLRHLVRIIVYKHDFLLLPTVDFTGSRITSRRRRTMKELEGRPALR
jgi:hypothetical protein